ncbi:MAG: lipopolysaccharide heptosyltransferase II [Nitrospirae bacterium GWD2_57_9]|nr:MAG: lipopolysaccharide heptosyltransferase II [Nitrospirae bacterium GWD2_57_9]OGW46959.1 MAG: lipopolysaccharide heptosyltransferase II [Nitrospirae bacterium GWC2_57_9]
MKLAANKILVMRYRFIGDTVLTVPFLRNLRQAFPAARIDLMIEPFSGQVIEGCPYVDRVIPFEFKTIHTYSAASDRGRFAAYRHYWKLIREQGYDAAFVLKRSLSSALLVGAAGVPRRIGFATEGRGILLTDRVAYRQDQHEVQNFLDCLRVMDIPVNSTELELWPEAAAEQKVGQLFKNAGWKAGDLKIVIHAAASLPAKQWPLERFCAVMQALRDRHKARFIYTGAKGDAALYEEIERQGGFQGLNLCGRTSLRENIAVYRAADLFFGVDSGPMHMASAAGIPVIALFGPTDERKWGPWGDGHVVITKRLACHPCKPHKCSQNECMQSITVEDAVAVVEQKIKTLRPGSRQD